MTWARFIVSQGVARKGSWVVLGGAAAVQRGPVSLRQLGWSMIKAAP